MKRSIFHKFTDEFSGSFNFAFTTFSGAASLVAPQTGNHLRIYNIVVDGPSDLSTITTADIQDGTDSPIGTVVLSAGAHREFNFLGRYWQVNTALRFTRPSRQDAIHVGVWYREVKN